MDYLPPESRVFMTDYNAALAVVGCRAVLTAVVHAVPFLAAANDGVCGTHRTNSSPLKMYMGDEDK